MVNSEEEKLLDSSDQPPLLPPRREGVVIPVGVHTIILYWTSESVSFVAELLMTPQMSNSVQ